MISQHREQAFWQRVDQSAGPAGCWPWLGSVDRDGYGRFSEQGKYRGAHRIAYELSVGPIPDGLQIDHLCSVRGCVNPRHLEPVTLRVNVRRSDGIATQVAS